MEEQLLRKSLKGNYFYSEHEIFLVNEEKKVIYASNNRLRMVKNSETACIFCISADKKIAILDYNANKVFDFKFKGSIVQTKTNEKSSLVVIQEYDPRRVSILDSTKLKVTNSKSFKELGLRTLRWNVPRIDFEILTNVDLIALTYMNNIYFYNFDLKKILQMTHSYQRTFKTAPERVYEELNEAINGYGLPPDFSMNKKEIDTALNFFELGRSFNQEQLKSKFCQLVKEYHPDINKSQESTAITAKIIEYYSVLKTVTSSTDKLREQLVKVPNEDESKKIDWFSLVKVLGRRIYLGTYSGRIIGINYERMAKLLKNYYSKKDVPALTNILFFQEYYFKSPVEDLNVVFDLKLDGENLIIETSSNPFSKKEFKNTWTDHKTYTEIL